MATPVLHDRRGPGAGDGVRSLVETAVMVPAQFEVRHDGVFATGAGHLMAAVLESAVHEYQLYRDTRSTHRARYAAQAKAWFIDRDTCYLYSFVNCCETLGIDADRLRRAVLDGPRVFAGRRYRPGFGVSRGLGQGRIGQR